MSLNDGKARDLQFPLDRSLVPQTTTPDEPINGLTLDWQTLDNDEKVTVTLTLSLSEYIALASAVDIGSDIAYGEEAIALWWVWVRSINSMALCDQIDDCISTSLTIQQTINNFILQDGVINPDAIDPITPQMDNRLPQSERDMPSSPPPDTCDKNELWSGIHEIVVRLDQLVRDFLEQAVAQNDAIERMVNIIDLVPIFGDVIADTLTVFSDVLPDLLNAYNAYSTAQKMEETACNLYELVCQECRYPTFQEIYDEYANAGISGIQDIAGYGVTAAMDYMIGTNNLANAFVWYTTQTIALYTLYLGSTYVGMRGTRWIAIWADIGEDTSDNGWELLCNGCQDGWVNIFDFALAQYEWVLIPDTYPVDLGVYTGLLFESINASLDMSNYNSVLSIQLTFPTPTQLDTISVRHQRVNAASIRVVQAYSGGTLVWSDALTGGTGTTTDTFSNLNLTSIDYIRVHLHDGTPNKIFRILDVSTEGSQTDPMQGVSG